MHSKSWSWQKASLWVLQVIEANHKFIMAVIPSKNIDFPETFLFDISGKKVRITENDEYRYLRDCFRLLEIS